MAEEISPVEDTLTKLLGGRVGNTVEMTSEVGVAVGMLVGMLVGVTVEVLMPSFLLSQSVEPAGDLIVIGLYVIVGLTYDGIVFVGAVESPPTLPVEFDGQGAAPVGLPVGSGARLRA